MAETDRATPRQALRPYIWALGLLWVVPAVVIAVGYLVLPKDVSSGQCEGIGFGCELSPANYMLLMGALATPVLFSAGLIAVVVIAFRRRLRP
ncbi:MAG TPA: hypothetical protein VNO51_16295 [Ilumatobacteraceae bacterium]|nr:hypothetical protein [Ilumatobacteraceae bacterium]